MPGISNVSGQVTEAAKNLPGADTYYQGPHIAQGDQGMLDQALAGYAGAAQGAQQNADILQQQMGGYQPPQYSMGQVPTSTYNMGDRQAGLDQAITAATNPVLRQLQEQILPGLRSSALESGAYSSDRAMGVVPGQAIDAATRNMQDIAAQMSYEDYNNWENRRLEAYQGDQNRALEGFGLDTQRGLGTAEAQQGWMGMLPGIMESINSQRAGAGDMYSGMMNLQQQNDQAAIQDALAREQYNIYRPFAGLDTASGLLGQLSGNYGTTTGNSTSKTVEKTGGLGEIAKGVIGAGMTGAMMFGGGGPLAGIFKGAGALGNAAGGFTPGLTDMAGGLFNPALRR